MTAAKSQPKLPSVEERQAAQKIARRQRAAEVYARQQRRKIKQAEADAAWYRDFLWAEYPAPGFTG
jgi:hypothetical protein